MTPRLQWHVPPPRELSPGRWEATARAGTMTLSTRGSTAAESLLLLRQEIAAFERLDGALTIGDRVCGGND